VRRNVDGARGSRALDEGARGRGRSIHASLPREGSDQRVDGCQTRRQAGRQASMRNQMTRISAVPQRPRFCSARSDRRIGSERPVLAARQVGDIEVRPENGNFAVTLSADSVRGQPEGAEPSQRICERSRPRYPSQSCPRPHDRTDGAKSVPTTECPRGAGVSARPESAGRFRDWAKHRHPRVEPSDGRATQSLGAGGTSRGTGDAPLRL